MGFRLRNVSSLSSQTRAEATSCASFPSLPEESLKHTAKVQVADGKAARVRCACWEKNLHPKKGSIFPRSPCTYAPAPVGSRYVPARKESAAVIDAGATRADASAAIAVPASYTGADLEVFIAFQAADGTAVSDSAYLGTVVVV